MYLKADVEEISYWRSW